MSVIPTTAEPGDLPCGVQAGDRLARRREHASVEVGLQTAQRLPCEDPAADGDERAGRLVEEAMRTRYPDETVADVPARVAHRADLWIGRRVARRLLVVLAKRPPEIGGVDRRIGRERAHPRRELRGILREDEVATAAAELLHGLHRARERSRDDAADALPGEIRVLLRSRQRELAAEDLRVEHEPRVIDPGPHDLLERTERIEPGEQRCREAPAATVEVLRKSLREPFEAGRPDVGE